MCSRVTAAVVVVGAGGEQVFAQCAPQHAADGAHRTFHLVEHHALEYQVAVRIGGLGKFHAVPFLGEIQRVQPREKYGVQIDLQQIVEILAVLAGEGVGRPVRAGKRVHERVEGAAQHHEKRVAHREALAAAQRGVLEDMCNAGGILGHRAQRHEKDVLAVVGREVVVHGSGLFVLVLLHPDIERLNVLLANGRERGVGSGKGGAALTHTGSLDRLGI